MGEVTEEFCVHKPFIALFRIITYFEAPECKAAGHERARSLGCEQGGLVHSPTAPTFVAGGARCGTSTRVCAGGRGLELGGLLPCNTNSPSRNLPWQGGGGKGDPAVEGGRISLPGASVRGSRVWWWLCLKGWP